MSKRDQLNQLLNEERIARATVEQLCNDWEWTLSDKEATIVTNEIVINKGKIVEIPVVKYETKEVVVDNTDTATIEMLKARIKELEENNNKLEEDNDKLYKLYLEEQREKEIWAAAHAEQKEVYEQQMIDMTSEFEYEYECAINKREEQIEELKDKMEGMKFGYENQIAKLKEKANKPQMKIEVVDDPDFNDVPEEKPVTNKPMNNSISLTYTSLHVTHDAIKAIAHDKANGVTFHFVWKAGQEKLPCFSATGAKGTWSRMNGAGMYRYGKQIVEDFKQLAEEKIINKTKDGRVKTTKVNKPNKPEDKPVVKETKEVVVETNDDPLGNTDDMEFDCYDC